MSTYWQWSKSRPVRRVTWVCGPEAVLAREVVAAHREGAPPGQCEALFAGQQPEREIWDQLFADPSSGGRRAVVYGAEALKVPGNAALLAGPDGAESAYTVFVSADTDFERADGALVPHLAALQSSKAGQLVRCCAPSKAEDRVSLVASWWPGASPNLAYDVLTRCGSLQRAWQACEQARMAGLDPVPAMAAVVCPAGPGGDLADFLMAGDRRRAMAAARQVSRGELGPVLGLLAARLAAAEQISGEVRQGYQPREAAARLRIDRYVAGKVIPHLAAYGTGRVRRLRRLLAESEAAWRSGAVAGVAESLTALW